MKKIFLILYILLFSYSLAEISDVEVYSEKDKFGLIQNETKITEAKYSKLIRLKDKSYLFLYKNKYGIISKDGNILIEPKYSSAQRYIGKYVKLGKNGLFGIYNEEGQNIIPEEYSSIDILYGRMFLVKKKYKYGLISFDGVEILSPIADDIYMPKPNVLKIFINNTWYEIEQKNKETFQINDNILSLAKNSDINITSFVQNPILSTGYGVVTMGDYLIKLFSSISPAYENSIDELILAHGADTASILMKSSWLVKFPYVYFKNYANSFKTPNTGLLSDVKVNIKKHIND